MRSSFGRFAQGVRVRKGITQSTFAAAIGESLSRVSQIEHQRTSINDTIIAKYITVLDLDGNETCKLREYAEFSNRRLSAKKKNLSHDSLHALLGQFGDKLSEQTVEDIRKLIVRDLDPELAVTAATLEFSSNKAVRKQRKEKPSQKAKTRPTLSLVRFVELCLLAEKHRAKFTDPNTRKLNVEQLLAFASAEDDRFDYDILDALPSYATGAFACIVGTAAGHIVLLEEAGFMMAIRGSGFRRHVICHEYAHHVLHTELLASESQVYLPIQEWAKIRDRTDESITSAIHQVVDTVEEEEAECFATMILIPWIEFLKGTGERYLAKDFGDDLGSVNRYAPYFKNAAVINKFREVLWERGDKDHPIFRPD